MSPRPADYTEGLGGYVLARRLYTGLSQIGFAKQCGVREGTISDMETERRRTPAGFLDTVDRVVELFDKDVVETIAMAEKVLRESTASRSEFDGEAVVRIDISQEPADEYVRAVMCRASVESGLLLPVIVCRQGKRKAG